MTKSRTPPATTPQPLPDAGGSNQPAVIGRSFDIYSVPLYISRDTSQDKCQTAADILLDAAERLQNFVAVELCSDEDRVVTDREASSMADAARILTIVARGMLDAQWKLDREAAIAAQAGRHG